MCCDGNEKKKCVLGALFGSRSTENRRAGFCFQVTVCQLVMLIIKCFDIDVSLFLSRLALERKINPDTSLQVLNKLTDLCF